MFCQKCGSQMGEDELFCTNCGAAQETQKANPTSEANPINTVATETGNSFKNVATQVSAAVVNSTSSMTPEKKKLYIGIAGGAVGTIIVVVLFISLIVGNVGYRGLVKDYYKSIQNCDYELFYKCRFPDEAVEEMLDSYMYEDEDDLVDDVYEYLDNKVNNIESLYGDNYKISVKIKNAKELSDSRIERMEDEENYPINKAYNLRVNITYKVTYKFKTYKEEENNNIVVIKTKSGWSIYED